MIGWRLLSLPLHSYAAGVRVHFARAENATTESDPSIGVLHWRPVLGGKHIQAWGR
jgi:hypothetical protein